MASTPDLLVFAQGAARGHPGPSAAGAVLCDSSGRTLREFHSSLGVGTQAEAGYKAVVMGLAAATDYTSGFVEVASGDSLVARQLRGEEPVGDPVLHELNTHVRRAEGLFGRVTYSDPKAGHPMAARARALADEALEHGARRGTARP